MKLKIFASLILCLACTNSMFATMDSLFTKANESYSKADYQAAIQEYSEILNAGYYSAELYFNLGNAYFKNKELAMSIVYFEKAKKLAPGDEAIHFNLQLANSYKTDKIEEIPPLFLKVWFQNILNAFPFETWGILSLVLFILFGIFLVLYLITSTHAIKKFSFLFSILMFVFSVLSFSFAKNQQHAFLSSHYAIVVSESVTLKGSPDISGTDLFVLHAGTKVKIEDTVGDWYEIKIADGNTGWLHLDDIVKI